MKSIVVHYQEIALKGRNRPWFVSRLVRNIREATSDLDIKSVRALQGRIEVVLGEGAEWTAVRDRLSNVFGAAQLCSCRDERSSTSTSSPQEILRDLGPEDPSVVSRLGAPRRQALSADVAAARA